MRNEIVDCKACHIRQEARQPVPSIGPVPCKIMFIGRNPGQDEDRLGQPFIGRGGTLLNQFIKKLEVNRSDIYITNAVKCYTTNDRPPTYTEVSRCAERFLLKEIDEVKPLLIVTFGADALSWFEPGMRLTDNHGQPISYDEPGYYGTRVATFYNDFSLIPCIHPGAALRNKRSEDDFFHDAEIVHHYIKYKL